MNILIIDAQGGGIGRQLVAAIRESLPEAEITAVSENGKMVDFAVKAWDESGPIGSGTHTRAIVKNEKFLAKCNAKLEKK